MCVDSLSRCNSFYISDTEDDEASSVSSADSEYSAIPKKVADHDTAQRTMLQCWIHDSPVRLSETFLQNTSEPSIPLQSLQWKSVTDNEGKSYERLLLTDNGRDDSIAYDGDFGFQLKAVHLESQVLPGSNGFYYSKIKDTQVTNIFVVRMKMTSSNQFEQTHQSSQLKWYSFPKLEGFSLGFSLADLVEPQSPNGVDNVSILPKIQHLSSRRLPVMTNSVLSEREILIVSFEHLTAPLYLDFVDEFRRNLWGRCVSSRNDRVIYQGRELSKPLKSDDFSENSSSRKRRLSSSESSYSFDKEQSRKVLLKMVSFKKPFTADKHKQHDRLSMNDIVTQLPFINIKKDLEVLKFFQKRNQDKKSESGFFPEFLHCAMDYHQLYLISSYFEGNNLPRSLCYPKQPKSDDIRVLTQEIEKNAKMAFRQILQAVQRLHHAGLSHLNICVENLVCNHSIREIMEQNLAFEELDFGLIDFGFHLAQKYLPEIQRFAYQRPSAETKFNHGRYVYHCPELEIYQGNANYLADRLYNPMKVDIWQLGILLLILTTGVLPFEPVMAGGKITNYKQWIDFLEKNGVGHLLFRHANNNNGNSQGCGDENPPPSMDSSSSSLFLLKDIFSTELLSLLGSLLRTDPNQRPEVEQILRHPWFRE